MKRVLLSVIAGIMGMALGISAGIMIHCSFMLVENKGCFMLPEIEPEQKVLVRLMETDFKEGDIVAFESDYYNLDGEGIIQFRRVSGIDNQEISLSCDVGLVTEEEIIISKDNILGKAVIY